MNLHYSLDDARDAGDAPWNNVVQDDFHVAIFKDKYPVTEGHVLFVPKYSAVGVIEVLTHNGISVPSKVKVVGFDDSPVATKNSPAITTIRQPSRELGAQVAENLIAKLNGESVEDKILDVKLIKRASTSR